MADSFGIYFHLHNNVIHLLLRNDVFDINADPIFFMKVLIKGGPWEILTNLITLLKDDEKGITKPQN